jgi:hypothetical protein
MITVPKLAADALGSYLATDMERRFSSSHPHLAELISSLARLALDFIGNSDALYHNVEHTMLVTLAGHDILNGRALLAPMSAADYACPIVACLMHDIGYVRGVLDGDSEGGYVVDAASNKVRLPRGSSDAALTPHHVDRSKLFVLDRIPAIDGLDPARIARDIECTRFPPTVAANGHDANEEGSLVRAADLIGQLGDPHYLRKLNALFHEFEETGMNRQLGYASPADLVDRHSQFYWSSVAPHIQTAIRYLNVTSSGRQWIANLYSNVSRAECGPIPKGPNNALMFPLARAPASAAQDTRGLADALVG